MKRRFLILGGDLRSIKLASMLAKDENKVYSYAQEKSEEIIEDIIIEKSNNLKTAMEKAEVIVAPTPFSLDSEYVNTPYSEEKIAISDLLKQNKSKVLIGGNIREDIFNQLDEKYYRVVDIMKREELAIFNTIATAEGTIEVAIQNTDKILQGSKVLILGFGRVAKIVATKFSMLSADVTCSARKKTDLAWIEAYGYKSLNINDMLYDLKDYDIVINTVPHLIIKEKELKHMKSSVLLIDLASRPGGIDGETAKIMGLKYILALALPGKIAPVSSAEFLKETIYNVLNEVSKIDE